MLQIGALQLLQGFVHSFNALLLPSEDYGNASQDTHAIIDYFRRLGWALGYYPWCEAELHDLDWFDDDKALVFHLETENSYARLPETITKLARSTARIRIGIVWTNKLFADLTPVIRQLTEAAPPDDSEILLLIRSGIEGSDTEQSSLFGQACGATVKCWLATHGTCLEQPDYEWTIVWPTPWGLQTARWRHECEE